MSAARPDGHRRADIQGLRAVAAVGVVAAHVGGWPAGGYLGVDVFFVVSGFVITGVLQRNRALRPFYARRARRILPAALLVLAVTVLVAGWAFSAPRAAQVRADALWAAVFAANWHVAQVGSDFFGLGDASSPLLHYWSLGVEEQFYLVWPWLFVAAVTLGARWRARRRVLAALAALLVGGSLAWAVWGAGADPVAAYYSSVTRAWELGAGALLATLTGSGLRLSGRIRATLSGGGLLVTVAAFLVLGGTAAPWPAALLPTLGTLAVLAAGIGGAPAGAVLLTNPVSRGLGDISYGVYLWHLPLFVVLSALIPVTPTLRVVIVAATLALAATTYALLERPLLDAPGAGGGGVAWGTWWAGHRRGLLAGATAAVCLLAAGWALGTSPLLTGRDADLVTASEAVGPPPGEPVSGPVPVASARPRTPP